MADNEPQDTEEQSVDEYPESQMQDSDPALADEPAPPAEVQPEAQAELNLDPEVSAIDDAFEVDESSPTENDTMPADDSQPPQTPTARGSDENLDATYPATDVAPVVEAKDSVATKVSTAAEGAVGTAGGDPASPKTKVKSCYCARTKRSASPKKKKNSGAYVWGPPRSRSRPSFSVTCPHVYEKVKEGTKKEKESAENGDRKKEDKKARSEITREEHQELLAQPVQRPWFQAENSEGKRVRYKRRKTTPRIIELAHPTERYVKGTWDHKENLSRERIQRLRRMLLVDFHLSPKEIETVIKNTGKKLKKRGKRISKSRKRKLSQRDWFLSLVAQMADAATMQDEQTDGSPDDNNEYWLQSIVCGIADQVTENVESSKPLLGDIVNLIIESLAEVLGESPPMSDAGSTLAKLMGCAAEKISLWIEEIVQEANKLALDGAVQISEEGEFDIKEEDDSFECPVHGFVNTCVLHACDEEGSCGSPSKRKKKKGSGRRSKSRVGKAKKQRQDEAKNKPDGEAETAEDDCHCACECEPPRKSKKKKKNKAPEESDTLVQRTKVTRSPSPKRPPPPRKESAAATGTAKKEGARSTAGGDRNKGKEKSAGDQKSGKKEDEPKAEGEEGDDANETEEGDEGAQPPEQSATKPPTPPPDEDAPLETKASIPPPASPPRKATPPETSDDSRAEPDSDEPSGESKPAPKPTPPEEELVDNGEPAEEAPAVVTDEEVTTPGGEAPEPEAEAPGPEGEETEKLDEILENDAPTEGGLRETDDGRPHETKDLIFEKLSTMIEDAPDKENSDLRDKLSRALEEKFSEMLDARARDESSGTDRRESISKVAGKMANWIEEIIVTAEAKELNVVEAKKVPSKVTSKDLREWTEWIDETMKSADDWASWISKTVAAAEEKAAKKKGALRTPSGTVAKLTRKEWEQWKQDLKKDVIELRMKKKGITEDAHEWNLRTKGKPFVSADGESAASSDPGTTSATASDSAPTSSPDTSPDDVPDTITDVAPETTPDVAPETAPDVAPDTVSDVAPETVPDVAPDTTPEVDPEVIADNSDDAPDVVTDDTDDDGQTKN